MENYSLFLKLPLDYWLDLKDPVLAHYLSAENISRLENETIYIG
jgi:hypothetical protein